jgi:hypothetical protein
MSKLHTHVTQSAETDHANLPALGDAPMAHGRVGCDSGAEERRGSGEIEVGRDAQDKPFVHDYAISVATISDASEVLVREVVREGYVPAELLKASLALVTGPVGFDHAADRGEIVGLELRDSGADLGNTADDLMARDAGIDSGHDPAPLVTDLMEIGVADTAEEDFDLYVVVSGIAPCNRGGGKRRCGTGSGVSLRVVHRFISMLPGCFDMQDMSLHRMTIGQPGDGLRLAYSQPVPNAGTTNASIHRVDLRFVSLLPLTIP